MIPQQYCLRWKHHHTNCQTMFTKLLEKERFCDVTLYCSPNFSAQFAKDFDPSIDITAKGVSLRAHRVVLASCSSLLASLLSAHEGAGVEPVLVLDGASPAHIRALLDYMYTGEMNVHHTELGALLKTAEELRIKGLSDIRWSGNKDKPPDTENGSISAHAIPADCTLKSETVDLTAQGLDSYTVNGGPPPLIKLSPKDNTSATIKRNLEIDEQHSPKRMRTKSEQTDESEKEMDWPQTSTEKQEQDSDSEQEWPSIPQDISSYLHTKLEIDDDESEASGPEHHLDMKPLKQHSEPEISVKPLSSLTNSVTTSVKQEKSLTVGRLSGPNDPRFTDVIKLNDYLQHGRRPQFWEEDYVKRVMEAVRQKELEMKQAAEILGVSYGTLYGRYRDVYGCINRPYRVKDFWAESGPAEVMTRLQRGELSLGSAAEALSLTPQVLAGYIANMAAAQHIELQDFEMADAELERKLKLKQDEVSNSSKGKHQGMTKTPGAGLLPKSTTIVKSGVRVAPIESLRSPPSPSALLAARPDLTVMPASRSDASKPDTSVVASTKPDVSVLPASRPDLSVIPASSVGRTRSETT